MSEQQVIGLFFTSCKFELLCNIVSLIFQLEEKEQYKYQDPEQRPIMPAYAKSKEIRKDTNYFL